MDPFDRWLDSIERGRATMSQRRLAWAERHGGLDCLVEKARARGVHLVKLIDEEGNELLAASMNQFTTLC